MNRYVFATRTFYGGGAPTIGVRLMVEHPITGKVEMPDPPVASTVRYLRQFDTVLGLVTKWTTGEGE